LRLLTRREYAATVADLLQPQAASTSTDAGAVCSSPTFRYDPHGQGLSTVVVAGTFNGWATTTAAGAWPLALSNGIWTGTAAVPLAPGQYQYKFVLNGMQWVTDPTNPKEAPDGQGGQNSVLSVACAPDVTGDAGPSSSGSGGTIPDPTTAFPPETRPTGFIFDDNAPDRYVSLDLMTAYRQAAGAYAASANLAALVTCDYGADQALCARVFVTSFGLRAFRRPLVQAEIDRYTELVTNDKSGFMAGVALVVRAMLMSSSFLYRSEIGVAQPDGTYHLTPYETAAALSYMLWGTMPDQVLFDAAASGRLIAAADIEMQTRRLLADKRARSLVSVFATQWLGVENVDTLTNRAPPYAAPFTAEVRQAMLEETKQFVPYVMFDGSKKYDELLTANYTFANEPLAQLYGLSGVTGLDLQKVGYSDTHRSGILGHGSILATNAYSDQTSPIRRGLFVRQSLLCQSLPPPPPNVPALPAVNPDASTRERIIEHAANSFCQTCHIELDPVGFGFENFNPIGVWRTDDNGPIDSSGDMNDLEQLNSGTHAPFTSLAQLAEALASSQSAPSCFVKQYYSFAHGYNASNACSVDGVVRQFHSTGHDLQEMVVGITTASDFVVRQ
jgi:hypothetical protein